MTGHEFNLWYVLSFYGIVKGHTMYRALCRGCDRIFTVDVESLRRGTKGCQSCGGKGKGMKHGMSRTSIYNSHKSMIARCYNVNHEFYKHYGGRGLTVCERWLDPIHGVRNFCEDMGEKPEGMWLERIDNNIGYNGARRLGLEFNCTWATPLEQIHNRRKDASPSFNCFDSITLDFIT